MRLIDADALLAADKSWATDDETALDELIQQQPTVDAEAVKHGHWDRWDDTDTWNCSACGNEILEYDEDPVEYGVIYCDHCGARMDEKKD